MHIPTPERKIQIYDTIRQGLIDSGILHPDANAHYVLEAFKAVFDALGEWKGKNAKLIQAANDLYLAGVWECKTLSEDEQKRLWTQFRDAANIPEGTATQNNVGK